MDSQRSQPKSRDTAPRVSRARTITEDHPAVASTDDIRAIYQSGRYLRSYRLARASGWWDRSHGVDDELLATRIQRQLGGSRRARYRVFRAWRNHRDHLEARFWCALELASPVRRWQFMNQIGDPTQGDDEARQSWLLLRATTLSTLRDFDAANAWWDRAAALPETPWLWCVRSMIDADADNVSAALDATERALAVRPWYAPGISSKMLYLRRAQRADEALALAEEARDHIEAPGVAQMEHFLHWERGDYQASLDSLERVVDLSPEMEESFRDWLVLRFAHVAYRAGDRKRPRRLADAIDSEAVRELADQCDTNQDGSRVVLDVPLVPQNHNTCAPASLTSIARYWNVPVEHEGLVEEICRDGTTAYSERKWATEEGWNARDFRMTWDTTRALIDAGVPFAFVTTYELSGHLQVAMGYDEQFKTVVVRDPSSLSSTEMSWSDLEDSETPFGSRAFLIVPPNEQHRLAGIELCDAELYDTLYAFEKALDQHDRSRAVDHLATLESREATHTVTLRARRALAAYDGDIRATFDWAEATLAQFPEDARVQVLAVRVSENILSLEERIARAEACAVESRSPILLAELASLLGERPESRHRALAMLWRALHRAPQSAPNHRALANRLWDEREWSLATDLYRFASCLSPADESAAWSYFLASKRTNRRQEAFAHLHARAERDAVTSADPTRTLADAYDSENKAEKALELLDAAENQHADDGSFLLAMAEQHLSVGNEERAQELLGRASGRCRRSQWLRTAARAASIAGDRARAMECWREVADAEPLSMDAQQAMGSYISAAEGSEAATEYVRGLADRFPNHIPLGHLLYEYLSDHDADGALHHLRAFSERHPHDEWSHREIATLLAARGDIEAARGALSRAHALGDDSSGFYSTKGVVDTAAGDADAARAAFETALDRAVDNDFALSELFRLAPDESAELSVLTGVFDRLTAGTTNGTGIMSYAACAATVLPPNVLEEQLDRLRAIHDHLFEAHLAPIREHISRANFAKALSRAHELTERFPLVAGSWRTLAQVHEAADRAQDQAQALERALALSPRWAAAMRELSTAYRALDRRDDERHVLERAIASSPQDPINRGFLAELLWRQGDRDSAITEIKRALTLYPGYHWGWAQLATWSDNPQHAIDFARSVASTRSETAAVWGVLAELLEHAPMASRLECLDEAIKRDPSSTDYYDAKAVILAQAERFEEALQVCAPPLWGATPPRELRGRAAWVRYLRGEKDRARRELFAIVSDSPDYPWGADVLLSWAAEEGDDEYLTTCQRVVDAAPRSATALGHLGDALHRTKQHAEAEQALLRALALSPRHSYATLTLVDVYEELERFDDASRVLDSLDPEAPTVVFRRARIAAARHDDEQTVVALTTLMTQPDVNFGLIKLALDGIKFKSTRRAVRKLLDEWMQRADAPAHIGFAWLRFVGRRLPAPLMWRRLARFPASSRGRTQALSEYVEDLADAGRVVTFSAAKLFLGKALRAATLTWGSVSYALLRLGRSRAAVRWLGDWRTRSDAAGWMLNNLCVAARDIGKFGLAFEVHRAALCLPDDQTSYEHRLWLSIGEAIDGDVEAARRLLVEAEGPAWSLTDKYLAEVSRALIAWRDDDRDIDQRYLSVGHDLATAKARLGPGHPGAHEVHRWVHKRLAQHRGFWAGTLWRLKMW